MKTFNALLKYHFTIYLKTNKFIVPTIAWLAFMYISYSIKPQDVVSSFVISSTCLFFIMLWVSFSYLESTDIISEQLIILKTEKQSIYYFSKDIFLIFIGIIMSIIGVAFPIIQNALNGFSLFRRTVTIWDALSALLLHIILAALGCSLSSLFQPRCMKNRKLAIELLFFIVIISIAKIAIIQKIPEIKYITWLLPPISEIQDCFINKDIFYLSDIVKSTLYGIGYSFVLLIVNIQILKRKLF